MKSAKGWLFWDTARSKEADGARQSAAEETLLQNISFRVVEGFWLVETFDCVGLASCLGIWGKPVKQADESMR